MASIELRELLYKAVLHICAIFSIVIFLSIFVILIIESSLSITTFGFDFIFSTEWDPYEKKFGAGVFIFGSFLTTLIAVGIAVPLAIGIASFISEYAPRVLERAFAVIIELLAGIPSVVYGLWGLFFLAPLLRDYLGLPYGIGVFTTGLVLSLMILPILTSTTYETMRMVPREIREGAYALGATKLDAIVVILKASKLGILAGVILGVGRAFGETMATAMLIGGSYRFPETIFSPTYTLASIIAHEFRYAYAEALYRSAMMELALVLLLISTVFIIIARIIVRRVWQIL